MKVTVATIDRGESRALPHTPCPDVQPEPNVTPTPTLKPPIRIIGQLTGTSTAGICPVTASTSNGPAIIPATIAARQPLSPGVVPVTRPERMPVAPMIRPCRNIRNTADNPINTPPASDMSGVNSVSNPVIFLFLHPSWKRRATPQYIFKTEYMKGDPVFTGLIPWPQKCDRALPSLRIAPRASCRA